LSIPWNLYDLWAGVNFDQPDGQQSNATLVQGSPFTDSLGNITVAPHQTKLFRMTPVNSSTTSTMDSRSYQDQSDDYYLGRRSVRGAQLIREM